MTGSELYRAWLRSTTRPDLIDEFQRRIDRLEDDNANLRALLVHVKDEISKGIDLDLFNQDTYDIKNSVVRVALSGSTVDEIFKIAEVR
jgi:hypothetical protein